MSSNQLSVNTNANLPESLRFLLSEGMGETLPIVNNRSNFATLLLPQEVYDRWRQKGIIEQQCTVRRGSESNPEEKVKVLPEELLPLYNSLQFQGEWMPLSYSETSYLSMQRSELTIKADEISWRLKTDHRNIVIYRFRGRTLTPGRIDRKSSQEQLAAFRRTLKPAPYDRRVLSMLIDYIITAVILLCIMCTKTLPTFWTIVTGRYVAEFENFDYDHALVESFPKASNGLALKVASQATLTASINVKKGYYDAYIVYTHSNSKCLKTLFSGMGILFVPSGTLLRKEYTGSSFFLTF